MVEGFETFREAFKGYEDCYTIIGGTACDILLGEVNLNFRATNDVDMILLIDNRFNEFGEIFWNYIKSGGYKCGWENSDELHFKMRARNDLMKRKMSGEHINTRDLKKHKNDIYRLTNIINDKKVPCSDYIKDDVIKFIEDINEDEIDLTNFGVDMELDAVINLLRKKYL